MRYDDLIIDCPVCDKRIPASSKRCPHCGTDLSMNGLDELEQLASYFLDFPIEEKTRIMQGSAGDPFPGSLEPEIVAKDELDSDRKGSSERASEGVHEAIPVQKKAWFKNRRRMRRLEGNGKKGEENLRLAEGK
jgi:hypothetical protein